MEDEEDIEFYYDEDYEGYEDEEEETCSEGYSIDECCGCVTRYGIETCEFLCPFGGPPRCGEEQAKKCEEEWIKEWEKIEKDYEDGENVGETANG